METYDELERKMVAAVGRERTDEIRQMAKDIAKEKECPALRYMRLIIENSKYGITQPDRINYYKDPNILEIDKAHYVITELCKHAPRESIKLILRESSEKLLLEQFDILQPPPQQVLHGVQYKVYPDKACDLVLGAGKVMIATSNDHYYNQLIEALEVVKLMTRGVNVG
jgi:hypothetical protein